MALSLWILLLIRLNIAADDILSINLTIGDPSSRNIPFTLWYNSKIYQFTLPSNTAGQFSPFEVAISPNCPNHQPICAANACIMIENEVGNGDAIVIDEVSFWTSTVTWYGISGRCIDDLLHSWQYWLDFSSYQDTWMEDYSGCSIGRSNTWICVDDDPVDCRPRKQILYFDITRPNEYIMDALWSDGTDVYPDSTCDPTHSPSQPTHSPSQPTHSPSQPTHSPSQPTLHPIKSFTKAPTMNPSQFPSNYPTFNPSNIPSVAPSRSPSTTPTETVLIWTTSTVFKGNYITERNTLDIMYVLLIIVVGLLVILICGALFYVVWSPDLRVFILREITKQLGSPDDVDAPTVHNVRSVSITPLNLVQHISEDGDQLQNIESVQQLHELPSDEEQRTECMKCGIMSKDIFIGEDELFVCKACLVLEDEDVDGEVDKMFVNDVVTSTVGEGFSDNEDIKGINTIRNAMKEDKIVLDIVSTPEDKGDETQDQAQMVHTTLDAMKQDKIALGIISTKNSDK